MQCPICEDVRTKVIDSREKHHMIYRRRRCPECDYRFTTYETEKGMLSESLVAQIKDALAPYLNERDKDTVKWLLIDVLDDFFPTYRPKDGVL